MKVWGVGANFGANRDKSEVFVKNGFFCLGWSKENQPGFHDLMESIQPGDLIFIKAFYGYTDDMRIKAAGIALENNYAVPNGLDSEIVDRTGVKVLWIFYDGATPKRYEATVSKLMTGVNRQSSIFLENDKEIISFVFDLIDCNKR